MASKKKFTNRLTSTSDILNDNITSSKLSPEVRELIESSGGSHYTITLVYRYSQTRPTKPSGGGRTQDGQLVPPANWEINRPDTGVGDLWFSYGLVDLGTGTIEWTNPNKEANPDPISDLRFRRIYLSSASIPDLPTGAGFDPVAGELTRITPWSETRPAEPGTGQKIYSSVGIIDTSRSIGNVQWELPEVQGGDVTVSPKLPEGVAGAAYLEGELFLFEGRIYRAKDDVNLPDPLTSESLGADTNIEEVPTRAKYKTAFAYQGGQGNIEPSVPTGGSYSNGNLTPPDDWLSNRPENAETVWSIFTVVDTTDDSIGEWSKPFDVTNTILDISGKQDVLHGQEGQVVGFDENGNAIPTNVIYTLDALGFPEADGDAPKEVNLGQYEANDLLGKLVIVQGGSAIEGLSGTFTVNISDVVAAGLGGYRYDTSAGTGELGAYAEIDGNVLNLDVRHRDGAHFASSELMFQSVSFQVGKLKLTSRGGGGTGLTQAQANLIAMIPSISSKADTNATAIEELKNSKEFQIVDRIINDDATQTYTNATNSDIEYRIIEEGDSDEAGFIDTTSRFRAFGTGFTQEPYEGYIQLRVTKDVNLPNNQIIGVGTTGEADQRSIIFHYDDFRKVYSDDNYDYYDLIGATRDFPLNPVARIFNTKFSHSYTLTDTKVSGHSIEGGTLSLLAFTDEAR